jgi:hypothetical protein
VFIFTSPGLAVHSTISQTQQQARYTTFFIMPSILLGLHVPDRQHAWLIQW